MNSLDFIKVELETERDRILSSFTTPQTYKGIIVDYVADCSGQSPDSIINNAKNIMRIINETSQSGWPDTDGWLSILPTYFTDSFSSDPEDDDEWSLEGWLYWFELEHRAWFLWDLEAIGNEQLQISICIYEHPFPSEALDVLFMKLGTGQLTEISIR
ncbi:hypothetical protein [Paenibacillus wenxiniae]|uniref:Uncharacterized protein n=1 Tax=Paenibacillus wenxiniae TaxID=1636843 RepID=A0ABW4RJV9_9BACL